MTSLTERKWSDRTRESRSLRLSQHLKAWSKLGSYERVIIHSQNAFGLVCRSKLPQSIEFKAGISIKNSPIAPVPIGSRRSTLRSSEIEQNIYCFIASEELQSWRLFCRMVQSFENSCMELVHGKIGAKINISPGSVEDRSQWPRKQWNLPLSLTGSAGGLNWQHEEQYYLKAVLLSLWYMWYTSRQHAALAATRGSQGDELRPAHSNDRGTTIRPLLGWKYKRTPFLSPLSELIGHFISELHVHEFIYGTVPVPADRAADCPVLLAYGEKNTLCCWSIWIAPRLPQRQ